MINYNDKLWILNRQFQKQYNMETITRLIETLSNISFNRTQGETFYDYVKNRFDEYIDQLNKIDNGDFCKWLHDTDGLNVPSKIRFVNLIKDICKYNLEILHHSYVGDVKNALHILEGLLTKGKYTNYRLRDMLVNYFEFKNDIDAVYYRCVLYNNGEIPNNCWHLPFNLRHKADIGRFNMVGTICMYVADSAECASESVHPSEGKQKWMGEFRSKKMLSFLNLTFPNEQEISYISNYDKFAF